MNKGFRTSADFTAALQAFTHGTNDAQKAMGIITFAFVHDRCCRIIWKFRCGLRFQQRRRWLWVLPSVRGKSSKQWVPKSLKLNQLTDSPPILSASVIFTATLLHLPVSTTHAITSAILGVGSAKRFSGCEMGTCWTYHYYVVYYDSDYCGLAGLLYWIIF